MWLLGGRPCRAGELLPRAGTAAEECSTEYCPRSILTTPDRDVMRSLDTSSFTDHRLFVAVDL
jgi:hypothetical protein